MLVSFPRSSWRANRSMRTQHRTTWQCNALMELAACGIWFFLISTSLRSRGAAWLKMIPPLPKDSAGPLALTYFPLLPRAFRFACLSARLPSIFLRSLVPSSPRPFFYLSFVFASSRPAVVGSQRCQPSLAQLQERYTGARLTMRHHVLRSGGKSKPRFGSATLGV